MRFRVSHIIWTAIFSAGVCCQAVAAPGSAGNTEQARLIVDCIHSRLTRIWNYQCIQVTNNPPESTPSRCSMEIAYDSQDRGFVRTWSDRATDTYIWDGQKAIEHRQRIQPNGMVAHTVHVSRAIHHGAERRKAPWLYTGHGLADLLTRAMAEGRRIDVEEAQTGYCHVTIDFPSGETFAAVLDPGRAYVPVHHEHYRTGELRSREVFKFANIDPGVWFPVEVDVTSYSGVDPNTGAPIPGLKFTHRFIGIVVNDPEFEKLLKPRLPEGTQITIAADEGYVIGSERWDPKPAPEPTDFGIEPWVEPMRHTAILSCFFDMHQWPARHDLKQLAD